MVLIEECQHPLPHHATPDLFRDLLARAVNLLCSVARDVDILRDERLILYADREVELLRQCKFEPFEPQLMFRWNEQEGRRTDIFMMRGIFIEVL